MVELLALHVLELGRVGRREAERVKVEITGLAVAADENGAASTLGPLLSVSIAHQPLLSGASKVAMLPSSTSDMSSSTDFHAVCSGVLEGDVRRHVDVAAKQRVPLLGEREADSGQHPRRQA